MLSYQRTDEGSRGRDGAPYPSTYRDHRASGMNNWGERNPVTHSWRDHTRRNQAWGRPEAVDRIMAGNDPATQADIARWDSLGRRAAA